MEEKEILDRIFRDLEKKDIERDKVLAVIRYGKKDGKDIDIFTIINKSFDYYRYLLEDIEITTIGVPNITHLLNGFDPIVTEPILTGEVLHEYILKISEMKKHLQEMEADLGTIMYLQKSARQTLVWAQKFYEQQEPENAFINLVFHFSYLNFSFYYEKHPQVTTFKKLLNKHADPLLKKSYARLKDPDPITLEEVKNFFP